MKNFKKLLALGAAAALLVSVAGCGSSESSEAAASSAASETAAAQTAAAEETASGDTYTIGICQLVQHPALDAATQGFKDYLTEQLGDSVTFDEQNASGESTNCTTICNQFVSNGYDLIMANATASLTAAQQATADIPILGTSVTDYGTALSIDNWTGTSGINVSGTTDLAPLDEQADMVKELFPDAKTVGILYCSAEANSEYQARTIRGYLEELGFTVNDYSFSDSNDVQSVTTNACADSDVIYIPTDNTAASNTSLIRDVVVPAGVPVVAGEEGICSGCGVATLSIDYYELGVKTGEMAYDILVNGADITTMAVESSPTFTKEYNAEIAEELSVTIPDDYTAIATEESEDSAA